MRAEGMGANVIVCEVDPLRALEAVMEGYRVMPMAEAAQIGDIFVTVTGDRSVIRGEHIEQMKDGAMLAYSGHFDVELDLLDLAAAASEPRTIRDSLQEYTLPNGRRIYVLGEGRLVNLAAAEGHPASVMDMSFANQALCSEHLAKVSSDLEIGVYTVPDDIDKQVARLKLAALGIEIDELTKDQKEYLSGWRQGT